MSVFDDPAFRSAIQRVVMDEIFVDAPGTYTMRVPDRLVDEIEILVRPHLKEEAK